MSLPGTVLTAVFASNAVFAYGLGFRASRRKEGFTEALSAVALILIDLAASFFLWSLRSFALGPLRLESLDTLLFVVIAVPSIKALAKLASVAKVPWLAGIGTAGDELALGSLSFGIALLATRDGFHVAQALAASVGSGAGYWMATSLLGALEERLELSDLPRPFKGAPAMLLSAGLMSMALMGIDEVFVKNLAG
ncbi:MAG: Rnf-Nqr domain containing protein [Spirochaetaceae bacterium]|nr:Rnf-Nqr domain containing protein [Spirochaetaceae bacterium]